MEAPQDHVMVSFVPGVPDDQILEQTTELPKDVASESMLWLS